MPDCSLPASSWNGNGKRSKPGGNTALKTSTPSPSPYLPSLSSDRTSFRRPGPRSCCSPQNLCGRPYNDEDDGYAITASSTGKEGSRRGSHSASTRTADTLA